ncbi:MAG TPA: hypothetical protein VMW16_08320 [Sedimentisphaerales bacterium]|nr:hypothetical protein [Sedimentisphaerales bacterium]
MYKTTIAATVALTVLLMVIPRKYFMLPFIVCACFLPADQRVIIMDLDFTPLRILVLTGFLRIFLGKQEYRVRWNNFDRMVVVWALCGAIVYCIQWLNTKAFINRSGYLFDVFGLYWIFRHNVNSWDSIRLNLKIFAICSLFLAVLVGWEWGTGKNPFVAFGRVITEVRKGRYRCQASFPHSIMLGLFYATLVPLFVGLAKTDKRKMLYWAAVAAGVFIVMATASSTPIVTLAVVLLALFGFRWRRHMGQAALGLLASLAALHIVMNKPVWHLIARVNVVGGSTGWHRYKLIDSAIGHFGEWAFLGCRSTSDWGWGLEDITNQYIIEGIRGGLVTLVLFLAMLYLAFRTILNSSLAYREYQRQWLCWCIVVAVIGHCAAFFGVSYFGQIMMLWYMMLSVVGFLAEGLPQKVSAFKSSLSLAYR